MQKNFKFTGVFMLIVLFSAIFIACGGGGGGSDSGGGEATPTSTVTYSLNKLTTLTQGASEAFNMTGTDTAGYSWTGSYQYIVDGPTVFDGRSVIQKRTLITLTRAGSGAISVVSTFYFNSNDLTLYEVVFSSGVTAVPNPFSALPSTVKIGDFGTGSTLNYSNGYILTSTWQVVDGGNNTAKLIISSNTNSALSEQDSFYVDSSGNITAIELKIYNFPSTGVTTTLNNT